MLNKGHRRKQQIINIAKDMFIKYGFQSTHIGKVCEELNIARGTVYQYFGNKREILYALLESIEEAVDDVLDQDDMTDFLKTNPSQKQLLVFINQRIASAIEILISEPIILKLIFKDIIGIDEGVISRIDSFIDYINKAVTKSFDEIFKNGILKNNVVSDESANIIVGGILFLAKSVNDKHKPKITKNKLEELINNYLFGLLKEE